MRMSGLVVHGDIAGAAFFDHLCHGLDIAIEQIDLAALDREPPAADDPRTPAPDRRHLGCAGIVDQSSRHPQKPARI